MIERVVEVMTPEGAMTTFLFHPEHDGPSPVVLYLMDGPGIRPALREMASRLAAAGYYVMVPNLYYRGGPFRELGKSDEEMHRLVQLVETVTPTNIVSDAQALLELADRDPAAGKAAVGVVGFCMSGGMALSIARAIPDRIAAAASIHGAWLVRDSADSPHLGHEATKAEVYLAWADEDPTAPPETVSPVRDALDRAGVAYTLDFLTGVEHGFAPPDGRGYARAASELHWERVHSLLRRNLQ